jgi:hypothetical protein
MDVVDPSALRAEHDHLLTQLSTRRSVEHFARAAVSAFVGLVLSVAMLAPRWDTRFEALSWAPAIVAAAAALLGYALVCGLQGRAVRRVEQREFSRLGALRQALGIDVPAAPGGR